MTNLITACCQELTDPLTNRISTWSPWPSADVKGDMQIHKKTCGHVGELKTTRDDMLLWLALVATFMLGMTSALCTRPPYSTSASASPRFPAWFSVLTLFSPTRCCFAYGPPVLSSRHTCLPATAPVLHTSTGNPVCSGAVADARLRLQ